MAIYTAELADRLVIPVKTQPAHPVQNCVSGLGGITFPICIFDPQKKFAALIAGEQPVEQGSPCPAYVQITCGRGGKTRDDLGHGLTFW